MQLVVASEPTSRCAPKMKTESAGVKQHLTVVGMALNAKRSPPIFTVSVGTDFHDEWARWRQPTSPQTHHTNKLPALFALGERRFSIFTRPLGCSDGARASTIS